MSDVADRHGAERIAYDAAWGKAVGTNLVVVAGLQVLGTPLGPAWKGVAAKRVRNKSVMRR